LRKFNIGIVDHPKLASIEDCWDEQTMTEIQALWENMRIYPYKFLKIKGIKGYLEEMRIYLNPKSRPVKHRPYLLNP
jgi:hypothetical protein